MIKNKERFQNLVPKVNDNLGIYLDAFEHAFNENDLKNIALTGIYGSGKSSLIESYKKIRGDLNFLHISLSHFKEHDNEDNGKNLQFNTINNLEAKILNQLIHQIDQSKIPQTNFKLKPDLSSVEFLKFTCFSILVLLSLFHIILFTRWKIFITKLSLIYTIPGMYDFFYFTTTAEFQLLVGIFLLSILGIIIYKILKIQKNKNFLKKLNIQGNEIDFSVDNKDSYFDKYLDEVLYLFKNSNANVFVFEDLDRYNLGGIFERLREVNTLINNNLKLKNKNDIRVIKFLFLLKDDIFTSKDRTKFFDFIIPVIPITDRNNSQNEMIKLFKFKKNGKEEQFLEEVSLYIDDMRILKNIYNEFIIYKARLFKKDLENKSIEKLLSFIIYKNIFPKDFSKLQQGQGFVFSILSNKNKLIAMAMEKNIEDIESLTTNIDLLKKENLNNLDELDALYSTIPIDFYGVNHTDYRNISSLEKIKKIKANENKYYSTSGNTKDLPIDFKKNSEYIERKNKIETKEIDLRKKIELLEREQQKIKNKKIKELITKENINDIFKMPISEKTPYKDIIESNYLELLKFLIRNGFICEDYDIYISYFYPDSLSLNDKNFLLSIINEKNYEYEYEINNISKVYKKININRYRKVEVLNLNLLTYLLKEKLDKEVSLIIETIIEYKKYDFIFKYLNAQNFIFIEKFITKFNDISPKFLKNILDDSILSNKEKAIYTSLILYVTSFESRFYKCEESIGFIEYNLDLFDTEYIYSGFKDLPLNLLTKICSSLKELNIKIKFLNLEKINNKYFEMIYKNNLYEINLDNIREILLNVYNVKNEVEIIFKNFTLISSKKEEPLYNYIMHQQNINNYLSIMINSIKSFKSNIMDDEEIALNILNNNSIKFELKKDYIILLKIKFNILTKIEDKNLWENILVKNLVYSEQNILDYFLKTENSDNQILFSFIESNLKKLNFKSLSKEIYRPFFKNVVASHTLLLSKYEEIISTFEYEFENFTLINSDERIHLLIKYDVIKMNKNNLDFIISKNITETVYFIEENIKDYILMVEETGRSIDNIFELLNSSRINNDEKILLLKFYPGFIPLKEITKYDSQIQVQMLKENYTPSEIYEIYKFYDSASDAVQDEIVLISLNNTSSIESIEFKINFKLLTNIMERETDIFTKQSIFLNQLNFLSINEFKSLINYITLEKENYNKLLDEYGKKPLFKKTEFNRSILDYLKKNKIIISFSEKENGYRTFGRRAN